MSSRLVRIRRERRAGWRKPDGAVIVDRTSRYGNPYRVGVDVADNAEAVKRYAEWIVNPTSQPKRCGNRIFHPTTVARLTAELGGRDLVCFCGLDQPCHADVLLALANGTGSGDA